MKSVAAALTVFVPTPTGSCATPPLATLVGVFEAPTKTVAVPLKPAVTLGVIRPTFVSVPMKVTVTELPPARMFWAETFVPLGTPIRA